MLNVNKRLLELNLSFSAHALFVLGKTPLKILISWIDIFPLLSCYVVITHKFLCILLTDAKVEFFR